MCIRDRYNAEKDKEYEFISSWQKKANGKGYTVNRVPMRFSVQTYADLSKWEKAADNAQSFLDSVTDKDLKNGKYRRSNIRQLRLLLADLNEKAEEEVKFLLQDPADDRIDSMIKELNAMLEKAKSDKPEKADISKLQAKLKEARSLYNRCLLYTSDEAKEAIVAMEEHLRYDKLNGDEIDQLSRGDLTKTHALAYTENTVMRLRMQLPRSMYLRGFVGGSFENSKWSEAAEGAYSGEYTGITEWLAQQDFYPWMQQDRLYRMSADYDFVSVEAENVNGNSKYVYLPYEAAMTGDTLPDKVNYQKDYGAFARGLTGQREYTFTAFLSDFTDYDEEGLAKWLAEVKESPDWQD